MWEKIIIGFLLLVTAMNVASVVTAHWSMYSSHDYWQRFPTLKQSYLDSQYVNKHPKGWIPDEVALSYAGGALIKGVNPVLIIADTPPLGKYLIGFSAVLFSNEHVVSLVFAIISLVFLVLIGRQLFTFSFVPFLIPVLLTFEPIFKNQLIYTPLLDIIQLAFLLGAFYFFNKGIVSKKVIVMFVTASIFLGFFIATKFFATGITILLAWLVVLILHKQKRQLISLMATIPLSVLVLFASYIRIFAFGYSLRSLFGIQKYIFLYHKSQLILPFSIWPLLLINRWYVWFGDKPFIHDTQWFFTWPVLTVGSFITIGFYVFGKITKNIPIEPLMVWVVCYILFFSFGQITSRYLVIYIPVLYLTTAFGIEKLGIYLYNRLYAHRD